MRPGRESWHVGGHLEGSAPPGRRKYFGKDIRTTPDQPESTKTRNARHGILQFTAATGRYHGNDPRFFCLPGPCQISSVCSDLIRSCHLSTWAVDGWFELLNLSAGWFGRCGVENPCSPIDLLQLLHGVATLRRWHAARWTRSLAVTFRSSLAGWRLAAISDCPLPAGNGAAQATRRLVHPFSSLFSKFHLRRPSPLP